MSRRRRYLVRDLITFGTLGVFLVLAAGTAWLSRNTDSPIIERAQSWPFVGRYAERIRDLYVARDPVPVEEGEEEQEIILRLGVTEDGVAIGTLETIDRRLVLADVTGTPPLGNAPEPPRPLPGRSADRERLAAARALFSGDVRTERLGDYLLLTDVEGAALIDYLDSIAKQVEAAYVGRYRLVPVGEAKETLVLYKREDDYRALQESWEGIGGLDSGGHASGS